MSFPKLLETMSPPKLMDDARSPRKLLETMNPPKLLDDARSPPKLVEARSPPKLLDDARSPPKLMDDARSPPKLMEEKTEHEVNEDDDEKTEQEVKEEDDDDELLHVILEDVQDKLVEPEKPLPKPPSSHTTKMSETLAAIISKFGRAFFLVSFWFVMECLIFCGKIRGSKVNRIRKTNSLEFKRRRRTSMVTTWFRSYGLF
jgi:hypothetical protein